MADYQGDAWQLYKQFIIGKDNGLFTMQSQSVKLALLVNSYSVDLQNHTNITDIDPGDWAIDDSASHFAGTAVMFEPSVYTERYCILTGGKATFVAAVGGTVCFYCVAYEAANGRLIGVVQLDAGGSNITVLEGDSLEVIVNTSAPFYRQLLQQCVTSCPSCASSGSSMPS